MTPTDIDALDLMRAKALLAAEEWSSFWSLEDALKLVIAIRQADAAAGVQSVPVELWDSIREILVGRRARYSWETKQQYHALLKASPFYTEAK